ncbi:hypothetical protein Y032_0016g3105 [Ancylostoma ceylanicum]|uniref:Uncharacterized protein n=1 Tax=Ancylostoma ceylanicum TaxID=53326 RepID=A0A016V745_9BILA|nr:hypothetical protein Y032_0016g3105 [Ancylostoma ceylanicum]
MRRLPLRNNIPETDALGIFEKCRAAELCRKTAVTLHRGHRSREGNQICNQHQKLHLMTYISLRITGPP